MLEREILKKEIGNNLKIYFDNENTTEIPDVSCGGPKGGKTLPQTEKTADLSRNASRGPADKDPGVQDPERFSPGHVHEKSQRKMKRQERAADALIKAIELIRAGVQKLEECNLELAEIPQTTQVRELRRMNKAMKEYVDNGTRHILRRLKQSEVVEKWDDDILEKYGN